MEKSERISIIGAILNFLLFLAKFIVGIISGSAAVISDALNSFSDIFSSIFIVMAVKVSNKRADASHPFGHDRAEPIAAFIVAVFTIVLGFEIAKSAFLNLFTPKQDNIGVYAVMVLVANIVIKAIMASYFTSTGKKMKRPAIKATGIDSWNDVMVSAIALIGVLGGIYGYPKLDDMSALVISLFILRSGYRLGVENIDYLMGKTPDKDYMDKLKQMTLSVKGVKGINDVRAHYVGNKVHAEVHIEVDKKATTLKSHAIGKEVQKKLENMPDMCRAFIHIDPI